MGSIGEPREPPGNDPPAPQVVDPDGFQDWTRYDLYHGVTGSAYEPLYTVHVMRIWTDPLDGVAKSRYAISAQLGHFSKYAALR